MVKIIRKNKKIVAFSAAKLKRGILRAGKDAKINAKELKQIVRKVSAPVIRAIRKRRSVKSSAIRKAVLARLDKSYKNIAKAWRKYDKKKK